MSANKTLSFEVPNHVLEIEVKYENEQIDIGPIDLDSLISHVVWWCNPGWTISGLSFDQGGSPFISLGYYRDQGTEDRQVMVGAGNTGNVGQYHYMVEIRSSAGVVRNGSGTVNNTVQSVMPGTPIHCKRPGNPPGCTSYLGMWTPGEEGSLPTLPQS